MLKRSIYVFNDGELKRHDNTLTFYPEDGSKKDLPIETIGEIYVMSEMRSNTALFNILSQQGIMVHYFNYYGFYIGSFYPKECLLSGKLLIRQSEHYINHGKRLTLARKFIEAGASNIYRNLRYYNGRGKDLKEAMNTIDEYRRQLVHAKTVEEIMGYEGNIRKIYYNAWNTIVDREINFQKRVKHPPDNMINTLISFVNSLVYTKILAQVYQTQLNPTISYLHVPGTRRFSLCLDISEIFKPLIADRLIFSLLNKNQITEKSFTKDLNGLHLTKQATQVIVSELDKRLQKTIKHKDLGKDVSYQYLIRLECYKLIKHLFEEKEYDPFCIWW